VTGVHLDREERLTVTIDGEERVSVLRQQLRIPAEAGQPPLAVERTVRSEGASHPPVILVHGFAQNRFTWHIPGGGRISGRAFCAHLASRGFEVLNLELRGHGRSRELGAGNARAFSEYVLDAHRVVERCRAKPFLVGHSLGGAVGVGVATETALAGLVQLAGVYRFARHNRTLRALARATLLCEPLLTAAPVRVRTGWAGELLAKMYAVTDIAGYGAPIAGWAPDSIERELLEERLALGFDWTSVEVWLQMSRWATGEPFRYAEAFEKLDLPLLVIAGDADPLVKIEDAKLCWERSGSSDKELLVFDSFDHEVHWGHVDLILGKHAPRLVWPRISTWLQDRCG
jgi:polyhydroxyalkanoate synthase